MLAVTAWCAGCSFALDFDGDLEDAALDAGDGAVTDAARDAAPDAPADARLACETPPDDSRAEAVPVPGTMFMANLCRGGDHDFYIFSRVSAAPIQVRVEFDPLQGDVDLRLYSGFSASPIASGTTPTGDFEMLTADPPGSQLFIEVYDDREATSNGYRLTITN